METVYLTDFNTDTESCINIFEVPVSLLIPAGFTFQIHVSQSTSADPLSGLAIYPCL